MASPVLADTNATYTPGLSERRGSTSKFLHSDALGTTRGITNSSQSATDGLLFDAFGMSVSRTGTTPTPFGFVGAAQYQTDADSGLLLLGHRYYDPSVGRFISSDPAHAGQNWYAYCENRPSILVDPSGQYGVTATLGGIGGVGWPGGGMFGWGNVGVVLQPWPLDAGITLTYGAGVGSVSVIGGQGGPSFGFDTKPITNGTTDETVVGGFGGAGGGAGGSVGFGGGGVSGSGGAGGGVGFGGYVGSQRTYTVTVSTVWNDYIVTPINNFERSCEDGIRRIFGL